MDTSGPRGGRARLARQVALVLALTLGPGTAAPAGSGLEGQGRVSGVDPARNTVTLEHGGIPGLFPAARSEFPVADVSLVRSVRPGDRVRFTLAAPEETHGLLTIASFAPEHAAGAGWPAWLVPVGTAALLLLTLGGIVAVGVLLWRTSQSLQRRVIELDHELGALQGLVTDTQDGVHQMARALEDTAATLRVGYLRDLRQRMTGALLGSGAGSTSAGTAGGLGDTLVVVQRGRGELYQAVESGAAGPGCKVIWDRRRTERRGAHRSITFERRRAERRAAPAETWARLGFQLVPGGAVDGRSARPLRPASGERGPAR
jgi:Cu/Ag efflux protein CusF